MADAHDHGRSACQRSVGWRHTSRGACAAMLGSCHRGDVLRIGISGGERLAGHCGFWGGPLARPGAWSGDEAQHGLITTPLTRRHCVPAIFLEPEHLLGTTWPTRFSLAADAFTHQTARLFLVSCPSGHVHHLRREPADKTAPCGGARYTAATFEKGFRRLSMKPSNWKGIKNELHRA